MARLFNYFPKTFYSLDNKGSSLDTVTNIISRFAFESKLKDNTLVYYNYEIKDGDTPEIIAAKFYGNPERHWIVLLYNNIIDPQYDWPLDSSSFTNYVNTKYAANAIQDGYANGLVWAMSDDHPYGFYKSIKRVNFDGSSIEEVLKITQDEYNITGNTTTVYQLENGTSVTEIVSTSYKTYMDYEIEVNESKRTIKLLKQEFVPAVEKEFKRVIRL